MTASHLNRQARTDRGTHFHMVHLAALRLCVFLASERMERLLHFVRSSIRAFVAAFVHSWLHSWIELWISCGILWVGCGEMGGFGLVLASHIRLAHGATPGDFKRIFPDLALLAARQMYNGGNAKAEKRLSAKAR